MYNNQASRAKERVLQTKIEQENSEARRKSSFKARPLPVSVIAGSSLNSPLLGLALLDKRHRTKILSGEGEENLPPPPSPSPTKKQRLIIKPPVLHSTAQAERRATFEKLRGLREQDRQERKKKEWKNHMEQKCKELNKLRESLH